MAVSGIHLKIGLLLACFFFLLVNSQVSDPYFIVTFPAVIESGSEAKFCVSLLNPNETLSMNIYLVHTNESQTIFQDKVEEEFHRCSQFKAPLVEGESVQQIKVEVKGEDFQMTETRKVLFKSYDLLTFIQTDKPIYNPGQTVNFRLVTMDSSFVPFEQEYNVVVLEDNNNNRIGQWTNVSSEGKILQLSHQLNPEAAQGTYRLIAHINNKQTSHHFKVKKYVLPKFEITLKTPQRHSVEKEDLKIEVCGKYTYGQALAGKAQVQVCRQFRATYFQGPLITPCMTETVELTTTGCGSHMFNVSHFLNSQFEENFADSIDVSATATEEGTDISMAKRESIALSFEIGKIIFLDLPKVFERGAVIKGKVKMTNFDDEPIADKVVYILEGEQWSTKLILNLTTDINGLAEFSVDAPNEPVTQLKLWASTKPNMPYHPYKARFISNAEAYIPLFQPATPYSPVNSELHIEDLETPLTCGTDVPITVKYYVIGETTDNYSFDIIFMVLSKGIILHHGFEKVEVKESKPLIEGKVSFKLSVATKMAPLVQLVAFAALPSKNIMASQRSFDVEKCFKNRVSLQFSPDKAVPGEENTLQLSAQPGSLCGLSAVDQSVFVLEPGQRLTIEKVFSLLPRTLVSDFPYNVEDQLDCLVVRPRRDIQANHAYETLKAVGLKMVTNLPIRQPDCLLYKGVQYLRHFSYRVHYAEAPMEVALSGVGGLLMKNDMEPIETIRKFFPETWIWDLVKVGDSGSTQVPVTAPDTITTWETEVFCLSSEGFGLAPPAQLTVFQPFFLELSLPYSIIRGEVFELKATIFNYLSKCIMVKVTPSPSPDYKLEVTGDRQYSSCLCANGRKTFKWTLIASVLGALNVTVSAHAEQSQVMCDNEIVSVPERGRIDTVTRSLLVRAEGTEKTKSYSWLLCPQGKSVSEELELTLPEDVIEGSARASISVLGDILGRALKNIDGLLQMPYGCGEQNIALLSPNIYILKYLEKTGQLTPAIREKATGFLKSGYQRQLNYKHFNGAYSTFGGGVGNTWLTAFVLRTFGQAKHFIFIDEENLQLSKQWLITLQREHGCFSRQGRLFNNRMKGGVNDDVTMTAYIVASFLELGYSVEDPVINKGLSCLKASLGNLTNTYATALLAYTFSLAGETEIRGQLLEKLNSVALSGDGRLHWSQSPLEDSDSLSVETTSYVLLATLTKDQHTTAELGNANRIVSWLVRQQNPFGGFSSTQDTVVALQALALYSTKIYSPDGSSTVTVKSASGDTHHFDVNPNNKLVYQEKPLQNALNKYSIEVEGSTCVSVGMALFYNVPTPPVISTLRIGVMEIGNCTKSFGQTLAVHFTVSYKGPQNSTNMVIVDIKVLSGFTADPTELANRPLVERVDTKDDHILIYLQEIIKDIPMNYILHMKQVIPVKNLKPAVIKVYDYYQTSDQSETEYSFSCFQQKRLE